MKNYLKLLMRSAALSALLFPLTQALAQEPTDNPIPAFYAGDPHVSDYAWTGELAWDNVYNILDFGAVADGNDTGDGVGVTDNVAAFQSAVDAAHAAGGGVVYIPAGTYYFAESLFLKSGVVVRGATPLVTNAHADDFAPPTKLEFPRYFFDPTANDGAGNPNSSAFKSINVEDNNYANNLGLVWLDINRAGISMSADGDGTRNRLVFGTRTNNVAVPDPNVPQLFRTVNGVSQPFQHAWQRFSFRFGRNIHANGQQNVLVANNRVNDKHYIHDHQLSGWENIGSDDFVQPGFIVQDTKRVFGSNSNAFVALQEQHRPIFRYADHYGIVVRGPSGSVWGAAPYDTPGLFRAGMTVRDNWVYTTMRVGYHLSGWGLKVLNNVKRDHSNKPWWLHPTALTTVSGAQTLENRGLDIAGSQIIVEGNDFQVFRHTINGGTYQSTDGEGILVQECCGGTILDDILIRNNTVNAYIGLYKMPYTRNIEVTGNAISGAGYIMVNANKNGSQAPLFNILVADNVFSNSNGINITGLSGGGGIDIFDNQLAGGNITFPDGITTLAGNTGHGSLVPQVVGAVRDYPILELEDPSTAGHLIPGETTLNARVTGSFLNPTPASTAELPDIVRVEIYADTTLLEAFTNNSPDPGSTAWLYSTKWDPAPGYYQLSARAVPAGYVGPVGSTEWFTVSETHHIDVGSGLGGDLFAAFIDSRFPGQTNPLIIGDDADPDDDGVSNLLEFVFGGNPMNPDSAIGPSLVQSESAIHLQFRMRDDLGDNVHFDVMQSSDLINWTAVPKTALTGVTTGGTLPPGVRLYEYSMPSTPENPVILQLRVRRQGN